MRTNSGTAGVRPRRIAYAPATNLIAWVREVVQGQHLNWYSIPM